MIRTASIMRPLPVRPTELALNRSRHAASVRPTYPMQPLSGGTRQAFVGADMLDARFG